MQSWGEVMFKLPFRLLLAVCVLAHSGCAYTLKESGHRDLDRSIHCCDKCSACLAKCGMFIGAGIGMLALSSWSDDEGLGGDNQPSANELWHQGYGYNNPNPERIRNGQET